MEIGWSWVSWGTMPHSWPAPAAQMLQTAVLTEADIPGQWSRDASLPGDTQGDKMQPLKSMVQHMHVQVSPTLPESCGKSLFWLLPHVDDESFLSWTSCVFCVCANNYTCIMCICSICACLHADMCVVRMLVCTYVYGGYICVLCMYACR